jgi:hypothetical protein
MVEESQSGQANKHHSLAGQAQTAPRTPPDDMIDTPSDCERWPFLNEFRGHGRDSLVALYVASDSAAQHAQGVHKICVLVAACSATLTVWLAIFQLAYPQTIMSHLELAAAFVAAGAFAVGQHYRKEWLKERHKAERCRLLKFSFMIRPELWTWEEVSSEESPRKLDKDIDDVNQMSFDDVMSWLSDDKMLSPPGRILSRNLEQLTQLRDYYCEKRLRGQSDYYRKGPSQLDIRQRDRRWQIDPQWLFKLSVVFVVVHALSGGAETASKLLSVFAACLPVAGSGIRTWRSAIEPARNLSRFDAKCIALHHIDERMEKGEIKETAKAESVLRDLWCAEQVMESEHREWLRLMGEAEWQG